MHYTYILISEKTQGRRYIGFTSDLKQRLSDHNAGKCRATAGHAPWKILVYLAFDSPTKARAFERYLKSGSGHAFAKRHFHDEA